MTNEQLQRGKEIQAELKNIHAYISDICWLLDRGITQGSVGIEAVGTSCFRRINANPETIKAFLKDVLNAHKSRKKTLEEEFDKL